MLPEFIKSFKGLFPVKFKTYFNKYYDDDKTSACIFAAKTKPIHLLKYPEISTFLAQTAADTNKCPKPPKKDGT